MSPAKVDPAKTKLVKELKLVCDFEGEVAWVLGIAAVAPYRVSELARPARLVLDVRRTP